jgi:hypothetical protein
LRIASVATARKLHALLARWNIHPLVALRCTPALAVALAVGLGSGYRAAAAIACGAALTVGLGVYELDPIRGTKGR